MSRNIHVSSIIKNLEKGYETSERLLWQHLQARRLSGLQFKRRRVIGSCLVHFVCNERKTVIELYNGRRDSEKDAYLVSQGYRVLAFTNAEVEQNIERVLKAIQDVSVERRP